MMSLKHKVKIDISQQNIIIIIIIQSNYSFILLIRFKPFHICCKSTVYQFDTYSVIVEAKQKSSN